MNSKIKNLVKKVFFVLIPLFLFFYDLDSFSQETPSLKREQKILHLCPNTNNILKFKWLKKFFHPCQTFTESFKLTNECYDKYPLKVSITAVISLSNRGIELYFKNLKIKKASNSWGDKVFIGFKILDDKKNLSFKVKEHREITIELVEQQFSGRHKQIMTIYGPQREGGQDKYENLIENELEKINDLGHFRFFLTISSEDRGDTLHLPGPILKDLPNKIKQRNTCE
ncbi:MAG: hypothetical protein CME68_10820 [Halobacteriovoraceae bacterium]|nr:hypothetical protein [Halobacteriovoraceae bacterium]